MKGIDKARAQRDAQRTAASRPTTGTSSAEQAMLRGLGVELYRVRDRADEATDEPEAEPSTDQPPAP